MSPKKQKIDQALPAGNEVSKHNRQAHWLKIKSICY